MENTKTFELQKFLRDTSPDQFSKKLNIYKLFKFKFKSNNQTGGKGRVNGRSGNNRSIENVILLPNYHQSINKKSGQQKLITRPHSTPNSQHHLLLPPPSSPPPTYPPPPTPIITYNNNDNNDKLVTIINSSNILKSQLDIERNKRQQAELKVLELDLLAKLSIDKSRKLEQRIQNLLIDVDSNVNVVDVNLKKE